MVMRAGQQVGGDLWVRLQWAGGGEVGDEQDQPQQGGEQGEEGKDEERFFHEGRRTRSAGIGVPTQSVGTRMGGGSVGHTDTDSRGG
jgi:hypothetical protein